MFKLKIMHKAFVNMVLTEEDEMVVPLCLIVIALAMQHLYGPRIIQSCWKRRWTQQRNIYGAHHALLEEPKKLEKTSKTIFFIVYTNLQE